VTYNRPDFKKRKKPISVIEIRVGNFHGGRDLKFSRSKTWRSLTLSKSDIL
jgi:hypothetical protein